MRSTITALTLIGGLTAVSPSFAQGTQSQSLAPKQPPVGHRQPRPSDIQAPNPAPAPMTSTTSPPDVLTDAEFDARLNRVLNSICRGC